MKERHFNRKKYFEEQFLTTKNYVLPYINSVLPITEDLTVLEIGCGEGGNLKPFLDLGCKVIGIDLAENKIANAKEFFSNDVNSKNLSLISQDIFKVSQKKEIQADLIIMRDTLEHIHDQELFLDHLKKFLKPNGKVFIAFPPWCMPFGGHQQMCKNRLLSMLPYFHLLPKIVYVSILKLFGESSSKIAGLTEVKDTRISIFRYKSILKKRNFTIDKETFYLINPNYDIKFKLKARKLPFFLNVPFVRDFFTTTHYSIISVENKSN